MNQTAVPIFKACELAGVSQTTMFEWIARGMVEFERSRGGSLLILVASLPTHTRRRSTHTKRGVRR
ncbi:MAG: hypothetical protein HY654_01840 [Acidobacteria bacterium]|nr:hypothetical protein [Acidobacteriota bacterium]